jgi:hypothetical protein
VEERGGTLVEDSRKRSRAEAEEEEEEEVEEEEEAFPAVEDALPTAPPAAAAAAAAPATLMLLPAVAAAEMDNPKEGEERGIASSNCASAFGVNPALPLPPLTTPASSSSFILARSNNPSPLIGLRIVEGFQHKAPSKATGTEVGRDGTRFIARTSAASSAER